MVKNRIAIISTQRSGTTMLVSMLDRHPDLLSIGEVFKHNSQINYPDFWWRSDCGVGEHLEWLFGQDQYEGISIKVMHNQVRATPGLLDELKRLCTYCICVERMDVVRVAISHEVAKKSKIWASGAANGKEDRGKVWVCPGAFRKELDRVECVQNELREIAKTFPHYRVVTYEDLVERPDETIEGVLGDLGMVLPESGLESKVKRLGSEDRWADVENASELQRVLRERES